MSNWFLLSPPLKHHQCNECKHLLHRIIQERASLFLVRDDGNWMRTWISKYCFIDSLQNSLLSMLPTLSLHRSSRAVGACSACEISRTNSGSGHPASWLAMSRTDSGSRHPACWLAIQLTIFDAIKMCMNSDEIWTPDASPSDVQEYCVGHEPKKHILINTIVK